MFGTTELLIVLAIVFLVFGARRLPALGKAFGEAIQNFKKSSKDDKTRDVEEIGSDDKKGS